MIQSRLFARLCSELDTSAKSDCGSTSTSKTGRNRDLQKTKMCVYFTQGKCGQGTSCPFAHHPDELKKMPNLAKTQLCTAFMRGVCTNKNCNFAHGEQELIKPPSFKKKLCVWYKQGKCRNGNACGFIHDEALPGKSARRADDDDASTIVPSSQSPRSAAQTLESDASTMAPATMPDENLFRMMAGRGSAPLEQQVKSMTLAIGDLQAKLTLVQARQQAAGSTVEGQTLQLQVNEMQHAINQLSQQCRNMEAHLLRANQPAPPPVQPLPNKVRSNPPEARQKTVEVKEGSSDMPPPGKKAQVKYTSRKDYRPNKVATFATKRSYATEVRVAFGMIVVAMMVMVEMTMTK